MIEKQNLVMTRELQPGDKNFIFSTWLKGLRYGNEWFNLINQEVYYKVYHDVIDRILNGDSTKVLVSCLKEDPEVILGYAVYRSIQGHTVLDWVFVKSAWRRMGIGKTLYAQDTRAVTHITSVGKSLLTKIPGVIFDPFL